MVCRNCGKKQATTHVKKIINGVAQEYYLCNDCALELGFSDFNPFMASDLWGSLFSSTAATQNVIKRCDKCHSSFEEIAKSGKLGCPECYTCFYDELLPSLRKMHSKTQHIGSVPQYTLQDDGKDTDKLKQQLKTAVEQENYEEAARLRDKIKEIESGGGAA